MKSFIEVFVQFLLNYIALASEIPSQWSKVQRTGPSIPCTFPRIQSSGPSQSPIVFLRHACWPPRLAPPPFLANFFNSSSSNAFSSLISSSNCSMRQRKLLMSPSNPYIVHSFERWCLWNSLYCDHRSLYNRLKSSTIIPF